MLSEPRGERIRSLGGRELAGLVVVALLVVVGGAVWYVRTLPRPVHVEASGPSLPPGAEQGDHAMLSPEAPSSVFVHVAGFVRRPGVYELPAGSRVIDALELAGGPRRPADLTSLNLAAPLSDGQQILVGRQGVAPATGSAVGAGPAPGSGGPGDLVNVNTATLDQLETLPGIGPTLGQRIIEHREQHGPFATVEDLLEVSGIGEKRLEDLRPRVTV